MPDHDANPARGSVHTRVPGVTGDDVAVCSVCGQPISLDTSIQSWVHDTP